MLDTNRIILIAGLSGVVIVVLIVLYYYTQYRMIKGRAGFIERTTGFNIPVLAPKRKENKSKQFLVGQAKNKENQQKAMIAGMNLFNKWNDSRQVNAPMSRRELNNMTTSELNVLYREAINPNLSDNTVIDRRRAIRELQGRNQDQPRSELRTNNSKDAEFLPTNENVKLKKLTAVYEPALDAPKRIIDKFKSPKVEFVNLGDHKGSVVTAGEAEGDIATSVTAQQSFQIKNVEAHSLSDGSLVVDGKSKSGRKFMIHTTASDLPNGKIPQRGKKSKK
jgi:hypothetical protein